MKVVVGSTNTAKVSATTEVFKDFFAGTAVEIVPLEADPGIDPTPFSAEACIRGGRARIEICRHRIPDADFYVGIESGILETAGFFFLAPWAVIFRSATAEDSVGSGGLVPLQERYFSTFGPHVPIGDTLRYELFDPKLAERKKMLGVGGIITGGRVPRDEQFFLALTIALSTLSNPRT
jgi:non-canonical (house-cleaning) NTP pyrophosphatase